MSAVLPSVSNPAVEDTEGFTESEHKASGSVEEAFLQEENTADQISPSLNSDPEEARETPPTSSQDIILKDDISSHLLVDTEEQDIKPPLLSVNSYEEDPKPRPHSDELALAFAAEEDVKPSPLELMMARAEHAKASLLASVSEDEVTKPCPLDLLQITVHGQESESGQADSQVNFWTTLEEDDVVSPSDVEPDSPDSTVVINDSDSECETNSRGKRSSESVSDSEWDVHQEGRGRAMKRKRSFQHISTQEIPSKAKRSTADPSQKEWTFRPSPSEPAQWRTEEEEDTDPVHLLFMPNRRPGPQHSTSRAETPLDFFRLFFTDTVIITLLENTNAYGSQVIPPEEWKTFSFHDMFSFLSLVIFMGLLKLPQLVDYWKTTPPYNIPFPSSVMSRNTFLNMCRSLQMCCLEKDTENQAAKGTSAYDRLEKIKPLFNQIVDACKTHFHPDRNLCVTERTLSTDEGLSGKHQVKNRFTKGNKLFALTDAATGYTWNFTVSQGEKTVPQNGSGKGTAYDTVMNLMDLEQLGTGYHLYFDHSYTSPFLLKDLWARDIGACGSFTPNKMDCLKTKQNDFPPNAPRGSIRWMRDKELLFLKWKDTPEVALCSTIHKAYGGETVHKVLKRGDKLVHVKLLMPPALSDYNKHKERDNSADTGYHSVLLKTKKWYRTFFYHFVDIAVVNAHILYKRSMSLREFREVLVQQLADAGRSADPTKAPRPVADKTHKAMFLCKDPYVPKEIAATYGRKRCQLCQKKTPVGCETCDVPLCFVPQRNCYGIWHTKKNL